MCLRGNRCWVPLWIFPLTTIRSWLHRHFLVKLCSGKNCLPCQILSEKSSFLHVWHGRITTTWFSRSGFFTNSFVRKIRHFIHSRTCYFLLLWCLGRVLWNRYNQYLITETTERSPRKWIRCIHTRLPNMFEASKLRNLWPIYKVRVGSFHLNKLQRTEQINAYLLHAKILTLTLFFNTKTFESKTTTV